MRGRFIWDKFITGILQKRGGKCKMQKLILIIFLIKVIIYSQMYMWILAFQKSKESRSHYGRSRCNGMLGCIITAALFTQDLWWSSQLQQVSRRSMFMGHTAIETALKVTDKRAKLGEQLVLPRDSSRWDIVDQITAFVTPTVDVNGVMAAKLTSGVILIPKMRRWWILQSIGRPLPGVWTARQGLKAGHWGLLP